MFLFKERESKRSGALAEFMIDDRSNPVRVSVQFVGRTDVYGVILLKTLHFRSLPNTKGKG